MTATPSKTITERLSGKDWTPIHIVAPLTVDIEAVVPMLQEGILEYMRDPDTRVELLRRGK